MNVSVGGKVFAVDPHSGGQDVQLIEDMVFHAGNRHRLTLSDATKLTLDTLGRPSGVTLKPDTNGDFSLDDGLTVSWHYSPQSLRKWELFEEQADFPVPLGSSSSPASITYRISNGASQFYWNGSAWVAATGSDWNTVVEVNQGIAAWTSKTIQVVARLKTLDKKVSPRLKVHNVLFTLRLNFLRDIIWTSYLQRFRDMVIKNAEHRLRVPTGGYGTTINLTLDRNKVSGGHLIEDVLEVYNVTTDPDLTTNLRSAFDPTTKIVTLTVAQNTVGHELSLIFDYKVPQVAASTRIDFNEIAGFPAILIENLRLTNWRAFRGGRQFEYIVDRTKAVPEATGVQYPVEVDIETDVTVITENARDLTDILEALDSSISRNPLIYSKRLDKEYVLVREESPDLSDLSSLTDRMGQTYTATMRVVIRQAPIWHGLIDEKFVVTQFKPIVTGIGDPLGPKSESFTETP